MTWKRTKDEVAKALSFQRKAIATSCAAFDTGETWEAMRLAVSVYVLVHDNGGIQSVMSQIGIKNSVQFLSSGYVPKSPDFLGPITPLIGIKFYSDGRTYYVPMLETAPMQRWVSFSLWWRKERIFKDGEYSLTRSELVFSLRNQEGSAHLDEKVTNPNYVRFSREPRTWIGVIGQKPRTLLEAELATMRQIAWETEATLEAYDEKTKR